MSKINTLFTPCESMLFEFNQENDLDQTNQALLQLLRTSTLCRYKLFAPLNHVLSFVRNIIRVWWYKLDKILKHTHKTIPQQMKKHLIATWESHGKTPKLASVQTEHACANPSIQINAEEWIERFEQWVQGDIYPFIKESIIHWNITNASGVFGSIVHEIGHILRIIMAQPLFKSSFYFSMGLQHTSRIQVTFIILQTLLSAVNLNQQLTDEHVELLRLMIDDRWQQACSSKSYWCNFFKKKIIRLGTSFYTKLIEDQTKALA